MRCGILERWDRKCYIVESKEATMEKGKVEATSVRIRIDAVEAAKIAASFKGMTVMDYVSDLVLETANRDIEQGYQARSQGKPAKAKR
jgi:hypothetical protein